MNDCLVIEELRHAGALRHDLDRILQQFPARVAVQPHREIGLRQPQVVLRLEEQQRQVIVGVVALFVHAANRDIEPDGEPREVLRRVLVAQIDDLVEFQPQRLEDLQSFLFREPALPDVFFIIRPEVLVHAPGRERRSVGFHVEDREQEPKRLHRFVEGLCPAVRKCLADIRQIQQIIPISFVLRRCFLQQPGISPHEGPGAFHHENHRIVELRVFRVLFLRPPGFFRKPCRSKFQPQLRIRTDVSLCMVLLVDLHDLRHSRDFRTIVL